jgi:hypothetical protein
VRDQGSRRETALKAGKVQVVQPVLKMRPTSARLKESRRIGSKSSYFVQGAESISSVGCVSLDSCDNARRARLGERVTESTLQCIHADKSKAMTPLYAAVAASKPSGFIADLDAAPDARGQHEAPGGPSGPSAANEWIEFVIVKCGRVVPRRFTGCPEALWGGLPSRPRRPATHMLGSICWTPARRFVSRVLLT